MPNDEDLTQQARDLGLVPESTDSPLVMDTLRAIEVARAAQTSPMFQTVLTDHSGE